MSRGIKVLVLAGVVLVAAALGVRVLQLRALAAKPAPPLEAPLPAAPPAAAPPQPPDLAAMRKEIETTVAGQPKNYTIRVQAATVYMRVGEYNAAIPHLQTATRLSPKLTFSWVALGDAATLTRKYPLARTAYAKARALDPDDPGLIRGEGQLLIAQEQLPGARKILEAGLKKHPDDLELRRALGNLYLVMDKARLAVQTLEPAVKQAPTSGELHYLLAQAYERDLHLESAIKELTEVVRMEPQFAEAWGRMGLYQVNLTRYAEARTSLERAIALDPSESHYYAVMADSYAPDTSDPANSDRAVELYRKALDLDARNQEALYPYAMLLTRRGTPVELREAVALFKRVLALRPSDVNVLFKLAETHRRLGDKAAAQAYMAKFQTVSAKGRRQTQDRFRSYSFVDTPQAHLKLAREHRAAGRSELAEKEFRLALERDPSLEEARRGLEQLQARRGAGGNPQ